MTTKTDDQWIGEGQQFMRELAAAHYAAWLQERRDGGRSLPDNRDNPYRMGYSQPQRFRALREALGAGDQAAFDALKRGE